MASWEGGLSQEQLALIQGLACGSKPVSLASWLWIWGPIKKKKTYLVNNLVASSLNCATWDLSLWHMDSLVATCRLGCYRACGLLVP